MVVTKVEEIVSLYREYAAVPTILSARIIPTSNDSIYVSTVWNQRDLERLEKVKFSKTYFLVGDGDAISTAPQEIRNELWNELSPSGKLRAIVRDSKSKKGEEKQFIEIWDNTHKLKTVDVTAIDKHGKIFENGGTGFGSLAWSSSEDRLLYTAELKPLKTGSYFDTKPSSDDDKEDVTKGDEFVFRESWGEQMTKCFHPVLCTLDWQRSEVKVLEGIPEDISSGQAIWAPEDKGVIFVGWCHEPWRLGLTYCLQRKSHIYLLDLDEHSCTKLSCDDWSPRSPRLSPDQSRLLYLQDQTNYTHAQCSRLVMLDWKTKENTVIVDLQNFDNEGAFQGLFLSRLPSRCFCADNKRILIDSTSKSNQFVYAINVENKKVTLIPGEETGGHWTVLDVSGDRVVAQYSSLNTLPHLVIGQIPPPGQESSMKWVRLDQSSTVLPGLTWKINQHIPNEGPKSKYPSLAYETILISPTGVSKPPLVVFPHGGPHTCFTSAFFMQFSLLAKCGFAVLLVNYRGSVGFGKDGIDSLPGNIGSQDVDDVQSAVESVLKSGEVDTDNVVVTGGSHGGFLTAHLIGQYPGYYKAAVARNPVTDLVAMVGSADIPDWVYVETGLQFDFTNVPNTEFYNRAWSKSPCRYVQQVVTPTMIVLGAGDKRVPPKQGEGFYRALKARKIPVRLLVYPEDCHPIIKMDSEADCFVNTVKWFSDHLQV